MALPLKANRMNTSHISLITLISISTLFCISLLVGGAYAKQNDSGMMIVSSKSDERIAIKRDSSISFEFSSLECEDLPDKCDDKEVGTIETSWPDGESLTVKAYIDINCGDSIVTQNYNLKDDSLTLLYYLKHVRDVVDTCTYQLNYQFVNLPQRDYKIVIKEIDVGGRCGTPPPRN